MEKDDRLVNLTTTRLYGGGAGVSGCGGGRVRCGRRGAGESDRNMYSLWLGFAYRLKLKIQGDGDRGYGINFNTGQYSSFASQLGAGSVCADADEYCGAAGMHDGGVDAGEWVRLDDAGGTTMR